MGVKELKGKGSKSVVNELKGRTREKKVRVGVKEWKVRVGVRMRG